MLFYLIKISPYFLIKSFFEELKQKAIKAKNDALRFSKNKLIESSITITTNEELTKFINQSIELI